MTRDETKMLIRILSASYANFKPKDISDTIDVWSIILYEYDYEDILKATKTFIATDTSGFAPSVSQIIRLMNRKKNNIPTADECWEKILKAIRDCYYPDDYVKKFIELPKICQKVLVSPRRLYEWSDIPFDKLSTVIYSLFIKSYHEALIDYHEETVIEQLKLDCTKSLDGRVINIKIEKGDKKDEKEKTD